MGKRVLSRLAAVAAGGVVALVAAAPAYAQSSVNINPAHVSTTAAEFEFEEKDCAEDGPFADLPGGDVDGWHFLLPASVGDNFVSLTLEFAEQTAEITSTDPDNPSVDGEVSGYFVAAAGDFRHAYVFTPAGWTLTAGTAEIAESDATGKFNLSHVCAGVPGTSPPPSSPPPSVEPSGPPASVPPSAPGASVPPEDKDDDEPPLATTGLQTGGLVALGAGLLAAGAAMMVVRRRKNITGLVDEA